ncbi:P1 family peptidase [Aquibaculum arenosum]|uniref:P1 family peptidase n=1 Tax=Aquibaculum arenosum TaxID=3032591 RepID=A0ABT5YPN8_9PROT|nr:P1 family peptidase [Fodinicurvata sp. CAU 1616]MDF2096947.1 P1 family peptidase [Fodinicurvata sp. CAU 1616]
MPTSRELGLICGKLPPGPNNDICDIPGVGVGHCTLREGDINTGVTAILPHAGNLFREKVVAASHVINGFGKSVGLVQLDELGTLETPILLTNTLSVGTCATALVRHAVARNPDIGRTTSTVNPVVGECNDGPLNDIQALAISEDHALQAIERAAGSPVVQGSVGAGTGMTCFGYKGGVGSASRRLGFGEEAFHMGILVLSNFGAPGDLVLPDGRRAPPPPVQEAEEKGSIIIVVATDAPLEHRQLQRVIKRAGAGLGRLGSFWGHGSGDIAIGFSTAAIVHHDETEVLLSARYLREDCLDLLFRAAAEATQEAVLNSLLAAEPMVGRGGVARGSLGEALQKDLAKGQRPD